MTKRRRMFTMYESRGDKAAHEEYESGGAGANLYKTHHYEELDAKPANREGILVVIRSLPVHTKYLEKANINMRTERVLTNFRLTPLNNLPLDWLFKPATTERRRRRRRRVYDAQVRSIRT